MQSYYPESLGRCLLYNVPTLLYFLWKVLCSTVLDESTVKKIIFVRSPKETLKFINSENVEKMFGGKLEYDYNFNDYVKNFQ